MTFDYKPLLGLQRDLYRRPRGPDRFRAYLHAMIGPAAEAMRVPLFAMNPMAKDHVPAVLDALLGFDADAVAVRALAEASGQLGGVPGTYRFALVVVDDLLGGWTNRAATDLSHRFGEQHLYDRDWAVGYLWASERPSPEVVRREVLTAAHRLGYVLRHGPARTLREKMAQEGAVLSAAGCEGPVLDADDLAYSREVIAPALDADDPHTAIAVLFGDAAGATLGFPPMGLSPNAGLAVARAGQVGLPPPAAIR